jgi:hypothetical protein
LNDTCSSDAGMCPPFPYGKRVGSEEFRVLVVVHKDVLTVPRSRYDRRLHYLLGVGVR